MGVLKVHVAGVCCASGLLKVQKAIQAVPGVMRAKMDLATGLVQVEGNPEVHNVVLALASAGFTSHVAD